MAEAIAQSLGTDGIQTRCAGFEPGKIGPYPRRLMAERGLLLPEQAPPTIFTLVRNKQRFDYVVTLCNRRGQENASVLLDTVNVLFKDSVVRHWDVRDFMSIQATGDERDEQARAIIDGMEQHIRGLLAEIRGHARA